MAAKSVLGNFNLKKILEKKIKVSYHTYDSWSYEGLKSLEINFAGVLIDGTNLQKNLIKIKKIISYVADSIGVTNDCRNKTFINANRSSIKMDFPIRDLYNFTYQPNFYENLEKCIKNVAKDYFVKDKTRIHHGKDKENELRIRLLDVKEISEDKIKEIVNTVYEFYLYQLKEFYLKEIIPIMNKILDGEKPLLTIIQDAFYFANNISISNSNNSSHKKIFYKIFLDNTDELFEKREDPFSVKFKIEPEIELEIEEIDDFLQKHEEKINSIVKEINKSLNKIIIGENGNVDLLKDRLGYRYHNSIIATDLFKILRILIEN